MNFLHRDGDKSLKGNGNHSIENALIQASSKGYTIDMILGNHERKERDDQVDLKNNLKRPNDNKFTGVRIRLIINQF